MSSWSPLAYFPAGLEVRAEDGGKGTVFVGFEGVHEGGAVEVFVLADVEALGELLVVEVVVVFCGLSDVEDYWFGGHVGL